MIIHLSCGTGKTYPLVRLSTYLSLKGNLLPKLNCLAKTIGKLSNKDFNDAADVYSLIADEIKQLAELEKLTPPATKATTVSIREGQSRFRKKLLTLHGHVCAISGPGPEQVMEAAHIVDYRYSASQRLDNGILLKADIHKLFDLNYIWVEPNTLTVRVDPILKKTEYWKYSGKKINVVEGSYPNRYFFALRNIIRNIFAKITKTNFSSMPILGSQKPSPKIKGLEIPYN